MGSKLRQAARGQDCQVRMVVCNHNPETTILAHYRLAGTCGTGIKPPDLLGAWACSACHDAIDGRTQIDGYSKAYVRLAHAEGCLRTIYALIQQGKL